MRSLWSRSRPVLFAATAALLLTAGSCGGGGEGSSSEESAEVTSAETSSSAASSTGATSSSAASDDPAVAQFCAQTAQYQDLANQLVSTPPEQQPPLVQEAAAAFDTVQPPAEIASDWQTLGDAVQAYSDSLNTVDPSTPEGQQQLQAAAQDFVTVAGGPEGTAVQQFAQANCGTAAPTS